MSRLGFIWVNLLQTLLRVLPFPCRTGLLRIGRPGRDAPVLLTGNFRLTVERVRRALAGLDAFLLVANSRGVNVWCAATGGLLTNHDAVSVVKTSGIEQLVDHRRLILPQLAGTGLEARVIEAQTGWRVVWGPVYAADLPRFLACGSQASPQMRRVSFRWPQRLEMAVAWAFPISLLALLLLPLWPAAVPPLVGLLWGLAVLIFLGFPLYRGRLGGAGKRVGLVFFDLGARGVPLLAGALLLSGLAGYAVLGGDYSWLRVLGWLLACLIVALLLSLDLSGSTPTCKSGLHEDRLLRVVLARDRCRGAGCCVQVCPAGVFALERPGALARVAWPERCVQCGACIVQCPCDALCFQSPRGSLVPPAVVRRFKLNLLGRRMVG